MARLFQEQKPCIFMTASRCVTSVQKEKMSSVPFVTAESSRGLMSVMTVPTSEVHVKRQPLRKVSPKRAAANKEYAKIREVYLRENQVCAECQSREATEIHHLCSGGNRAGSLVNSETWLGLCASCHRDMESWPTVVQVTLKVNHVLRTINRLRGRSPNAITLEDLR